MDGILLFSLYSVSSFVLVSFSFDYIFPRRFSSYYPIFLLTFPSAPRTTRAGDRLPRPSSPAISSLPQFFLSRFHFPYNTNPGTWPYHPFLNVQTSSTALAVTKLDTMNVPQTQTQADSGHIKFPSSSGSLEGEGKSPKGSSKLKGEVRKMGIGRHHEA